jgi:hypothetical protein
VSQPARGEIIRSGARSLVRPRTVKDLIQIDNRTIVEHAELQSDAFLDQEEARYGAMTAGVREEGAGYIADRGIEVLRSSGERAAQVSQELPFLGSAVARVVRELAQTVVEEQQRYRRGW